MPVPSDLEYHPYLLSYTALDARWQQNRNLRENLEKPLRELQGKCDAYRKANIIGEVDPSLYKVLEYVPAGHADTLGFVLLDDIEPAHWITSGSDSTVREVGLGFCFDLKGMVPKVVDTLLGDRGRNTCDSQVTNEFLKDWNPFVAPAEMFGAEANPQEIVFFCSLKLAPVASLGFGLRTYQGLLKAIIASILTGCNEIRTKPQVADRFAQYQVHHEDLSELKICLLDMQGQEEIGILFFTNNLTLPMALLGRIRTITFSDICTHDLDLSEDWMKSKLWTEVKASLKEDSNTDIPDTGLDQAVLDTHAFRWSRTITAVSTSSLSHRSKKLRGYVLPIPGIRIAPGHQHHLMAKMNRALRRMRRASTPLPGCRAHCIGRSDVVLGADESALYIPISDFVGSLKQIAFAAVKDAKSGKHLRYRELLSIQTTLVIPVPNFGDHDPFCCDFDPKKHLDVFGALLTSRSELLGQTLNEMEALLKGIGLPLSIMRTIAYLYDNARSVLSDPYQFHCVIDLYDCFATLHSVLTTHLPNLLKSTERGKQALPDDALEALADYIESIQIALDHRLYRAFPEETVRETKIDFRGGLNQFLTAADAILKTALGIHRYHVWKQYDRRNKVGVVTRIDFDPGVEIVRLRLGIEDKAQLATVRTDVQHLHHVPSYFDFLHEAFHLIFDGIVDGACKDEQSFGTLAHYMGSRANSGGKARETCGLLYIRLAEIFVNSLSALFLCPGDPKSLAAHMLIQFAGSSESDGRPTHQRRQRYSELSSIAFMFSDILEQMAAHYSEIVPGWDRKAPDMAFGRNWVLLANWWKNNPSESPSEFAEWADVILSDIRDQSVRYGTFLQNTLTIHWEFNEPDSDRGDFQKRNLCFLENIRPMVASIIEKAVRLFSEEAKLSMERMPDLFEAMHTAFDGMRESAAIRPFILAPNKPLPEGHSETDGRLDSAFLLSSVLGKILRQRTERILAVSSNGKKQALHRDHAISLIDWAANLEDQANPASAGDVFLIDRLASGILHWPYAEGRKKRLLSQIQVIKTAWGIASHYSANRLIELCSLRRGA